MKFYDEKESTTIKSYQTNNKLYEITYLNGECDYYYNSDEKHALEIEEKILKQILKRDEDLYKKVKLENITSTITFLLSLPLTFISFSKNSLILILASLILNAILLKQTITARNRIKELKKYRIFIEIKEELNKKENHNIYDIIEFEKEYQIELNLKTIDKFSYGDVKRLKKELDRRKTI